MNENMWYLSFGVWVTSDNIMFPSPIYVSENFIRFSLDMNKILLCIGTFHYSFIGWWNLVCFFILAVMNGTLINMDESMSLC